MNLIEKLEASGLIAPGYFNAVRRLIEQHEAEQAMTAQRLRGLLNMIGLGDAVPKSDTELMSVLFSVLGMIRRKFEEQAKSTGCVPDGWKLVPIEMTNDQAWAVEKVTNCYGGSAADIYREMLSAAPQPPVQPPKYKLTDEQRQALKQAAETGTTVAELPGGSLMFINRGEQPEDNAEWDCPHCGGSGHKGDIQPPIVGQPKIGLVAAFDDGEEVWLSSHTGGAHKDGSFAELSLTFNPGDGSPSYVRCYRDINLPALPVAQPLVQPAKMGDKKTESLKQEGCEQVGVYMRKGDKVCIVTDMGRVEWFDANEYGGIQVQAPMMAEQDPYNESILPENYIANCENLTQVYANPATIAQHPYAYEVPMKHAYEVPMKHAYEVPMKHAYEVPMKHNAGRELAFAGWFHNYRNTLPDDAIPLYTHPAPPDFTNAELEQKVVDLLADNARLYHSLKVALSAEVVRDAERYRYWKNWWLNEESDVKQLPDDVDMDNDDTNGGIDEAFDRAIAAQKATS